MNLRTKLCALMIVVTLLATTLVGGVAYWRGKQGMTEMVGNSLQDVAVQAMDKIDRALYERMQNTKAWSKLGVMDEMFTMDLDGNIAQLLKSEKKSYGVYHDIIAVDTDGAPLATSYKTLPDISLKDEPCFEKAKAGEPCYALTRTQDDNGKSISVVAFYAPTYLSYDDTEITGVLCARYNLANVRAMMDTIKLTDNLDDQRITLFDANGLVIIDGKPEHTLVSSIKDEKWKSAQTVMAMAQQALKSEKAIEDNTIATSGYGQDAFADMNALVGYATSRGHGSLPPTGWGIVIEENTSAALKAVSKLAMSVAIVTILALTRTTKVWPPQKIPITHCNY